jgi:hypothetical protein
MSAQLLAVFDLEQPETWIPVAAGVGFGGLVLLLVFFLTRRPAPRPPEAPSEPSPSEPVHDPFVAGSFLERRASPRRRGHSVAVWISDARAEARPISGLVSDRSVEGLGLAVNEAFEVGTILSVRPAAAPSTVAWVQVEVMNCRRKDAGWELGCRYVHTPPWNTRMLFG